MVTREQDIEELPVSPEPLLSILLETIQRMLTRIRSYALVFLTIFFRYGLVMSYIWYNLALLAVSFIIEVPYVTYLIGAALCTLKIGYECFRDQHYRYRPNYYSNVLNDCTVTAFIFVMFSSVFGYRKAFEGHDSSIPLQWTLTVRPEENSGIRA
ncbi:unnamed protein product [Kuraishia capsulata CBS 1993]|uniref:Uncharacterized protein n=1 Tax=Kuraishia capsulata CBS 1993 TaxID=1382522 RepID=W6MJL6_9ASCO|nr:uncharacterized protein KUCA_T00002708001 [Kuraishia capsulata CBS 1993]CDK26734.1 unnamed protein product [Kuraishia capsulata CBS 1993]